MKKQTNKQTNKQKIENKKQKTKKINRGGLSTFHGPGQLVVYPILNLQKFKPSVRWYVSQLEETIIQTCLSYGLKAERTEHTGVWIGMNKVAAIGIHVTHSITYHGLSLNCNTDLSWFNDIVPCGIADRGVTSITKELEKGFCLFVFFLPS